MSSKRPNNGSDIGGILKRKTPTTVTQINEKNLLIFGYGCKIFRDDDKAQFIDQGEHLIPWMGNNNHKIDRLIQISVLLITFIYLIIISF